MGAAMNPSVIALVVFVALVSALGAVVLGLRDLRAARQASATRSQAGRRSRLRRIPKETPAESAGPVGSFDRWFVRLVKEGGIGWHPNAAALALVLSGLLAAGALFLWKEQLLPACFGMIVGVPIPLAYLVVRRWRRIKQLQDQLPPALEFLSRSVRAGETLDQAIAHLGKNSPEPLASEFRQCALQLDMGLGVPAVMRSLVERLGLYDVRIFATTLIVHRESGGNIASVLDRLARVIRDRLSYRRQLRVATAAGRISAGLVSLVAPLLFLFFFFFQPHYVKALLEAPLGQSMLVLAVFLEIVGLIWTARLLKPAY